MTLTGITITILIALLATYFIIRLIHWSVEWRDRKEITEPETFYEIDPDGIYCISDYKKAKDGSLSLCGEELDPLEPDIPFELIPTNQNCATCVRIEQLIKEGQ